MEIRIEQDGGFIPVNRVVVRHAIVGILAPTMEGQASRDPLAIAFVIDRSGSMAGSPLKLACEATAHAISRLHETDQFAIVLYDHEVEVLATLSSADRGARADAIRKLRDVSARGTTDLAAGWELGARLVAEARSDGDLVRRCLLLTDGMANEGVTDVDELRARASRWRADGVTLTTMGLGHEFDEVLLGSLADVGGGALRYVRTEDDLVKQFDEELGEALEVVARDIDLELVFDDGVELTCLSPFDAHVRAGRMCVKIGDLVSQQELVLLIEATMKAEREGETLGFGACVRNSKESRMPPEGRAGWTAVNSKDCYDSRERSVVSVVVEHIVAATREAAVEHNLSGDFDGVERALDLGDASLERLQADSVTDAAREVLHEHRSSWSRPLPAEEAKEAYTRSFSLRRSRSEDGSSRRR